ncbi:DUF4124 domain-containing protein [Massilia niastensis]|uniref:DUF4124 domain-containing protein n=1 Tax=Massilia niastensis TaxID=544911 RepID=UPI00035C32C6|nr:DUF4124 domain-containing protein [Massilia niastensis]
MLRHLSVLTACALCQAAVAGTIYKCVEAGRTSYGDRPCAHAARGAELAIQATPVPDPEVLARLAAQRELVLELDKQRAAQSDREERESVRARRDAAAQARRCARLRLQGKWAEEDAARSEREQAGAARIKARRQAEALAVECPA